MNSTTKDVKQRMDKTVENFRGEIAKIRTGKATTALLDGIKVDYYGSLSPLSQVANVSVHDAHTLMVTPWDKSMVPAVEKAILTADLGFNPMSDGTNVRVPIPPLTEERRKEFVKIVKKQGEDAKVALRNVRRDGNEQLKKLEKDKAITEDERKASEDETQKLTNEHTNMIDELIKRKEAEIMSI
jgi:ribosome recycling factor